MHLHMQNNGSSSGSPITSLLYKLDMHMHMQNASIVSLCSCSYSCLYNNGYNTVTTIAACSPRYLPKHIKMWDFSTIIRLAIYTTRCLLDISILIWNQSYVRYVYSNGTLQAQNRIKFEETRNDPQTILKSNVTGVERFCVYRARLALLEE